MTEQVDTAHTQPFQLVRIVFKIFQNIAQYPAVYIRRYTKVLRSREKHSWWNKPSLFIQHKNQNPEVVCTFTTGYRIYLEAVNKQA